MFQIDYLLIVLIAKEDKKNPEAPDYNLTTAIMFKYINYVLFLIYSGCKVISGDILTPFLYLECSRC